MEADALDPLDRLIAERACERLVVEFVRTRDLGEPGDVAELFTPDGVWEWAEGDRRIEGRDALRAYFGARPADRLSRRLCTNILVTLTSASSATASTYFTTYRVDGHRRRHAAAATSRAGRTLRGHVPQGRRPVAPRGAGHVPRLRRTDRTAGSGGLPARGVEDGAARRDETPGARQEDLPGTG